MNFVSAVAFLSRVSISAKTRKMQHGVFPKVDIINPELGASNCRADRVRFGYRSCDVITPPPRVLSLPPAGIQRIFHRSEMLRGRRKD